MKNFDPVLVEVVKHELISVAEEVAIAISKTGRSAMVKMGDFGVGICDARGKIMGPGYAAALQMANFAEVMGALFRKWEGRIAPGDLFLTNDPLNGSGHMPDIAVISPVFWRGQLAAFTIAYSHHTDIGGRFSGGMSSQARNSFEEGIRLPLVKLADAGVRNEALMETLLGNIRAPEDFKGDIEAKIAGCWRGENEIKALLDKYGIEGLDSCARYLNEYSERVVREMIREIPDGSYVAEDHFEDDGFGGSVKLPLKVTLTVKGDELKLDFAGTGPQEPSGINVPFGMSKAMAIGALNMIIGPELPINEGYMRPITIDMPSGSLFNPVFPGAVGGRAPLMFRVADIVLRALAKALPDRVPVGQEGGDVLHFSGKRPSGKDFALMDIFSGGWGGRPKHDGIDGISPIMIGGYGTIPAELIEREYPLVVEGFGLVPDSGGAGKHRGGLAVYRQWRFLAPGHIMVRTMKPARAGAGLQGGASGAVADSYLTSGGERRVLPQQSHLHVDVKPGDVLYHVTPGAGGHGDPLERDPDAVLQDYLDEKVTVPLAAERYGVVIDAAAGCIDHAGTRKKRASASAVK